MNIPFPYDWIAGWKEQYKIELSDAAEKELVDIMQKISTD